MHLRASNLSIALVGLVLITACAPSQGTSAPSGPAAAVPPAPEKSLTVASQVEQASWDETISGAAGSGAYKHTRNIGFNGLTMALRSGENELRLAAELPAIGKDTWLVRPDGTMTMTWKLRKDAKWHDGTPVTSADFVFSHNLRSDPDVAKGQISAATKLITSIEAPDPYTVVTHWKSTSLLGQYGGNLDPLPKHILEATAQGPDRANLGQQRYFFDEYVGTGPFKLVHWERGSFMNFERFDEYFKGPAKINRLTVRFIQDVNTMAANFLAGAVDVVLPLGVEFQLGLDLQDKFKAEGTGHTVQIESRAGPNSSEIMVDPTYARPLNGMTQQPVRLALLLALDRKELMEVMTAGYSEIVNNPYHPSTEPYQYVKQYVESPTYPWNYPYDVRRAQDLLTSAGWTKGSDGILVHQPSGERFDYQQLVRQGSGPLKQGAIIQQYYKAVGVNVDLHQMTAVEAGDNKFVGTKPGSVMITSGANEVRRYHSNDIPRESNNWTGGSNRGRWTDPKMDAIIQKIEVTIEPAPLRDAYRTYVDEVYQQLPYHPYFWEVVPTLVAKGVTGPLLVGSTSTNNVWEWDKN